MPYGTAPYYFTCALRVSPPASYMAFLGLRHPRGGVQVPAIGDYAMRPTNSTYRYSQPDPLLPFGRAPAPPRAPIHAFCSLPLQAVAIASFGTICHRVLIRICDNLQLKTCRLARSCRHANGAGPKAPPGHRLLL